MKGQLEDAGKTNGRGYKYRSPLEIDLSVDTSSKTNKEKFFSKPSFSSCTRKFNANPLREEDPTDAKKRGQKVSQSPCLLIVGTWLVDSSTFFYKEQ